MWFRAAGHVKALSTSSLLRHRNEADNARRRNKSRRWLGWVGLPTCKRSPQLGCSVRSHCTLLGNPREEQVCERRGKDLPGSRAKRAVCQHEAASAGATATRTKEEKSTELSGGRPSPQVAAAPSGCALGPALSGTLQAQPWDPGHGEAKGSPSCSTPPSRFSCLSNNEHKQRASGLGLALFRLNDAALTFMVS